MQPVMAKKQNKKQGNKNRKFKTDFNLWSDEQMAILKKLKNQLPEGEKPEDDKKLKKKINKKINKGTQDPVQIEIKNKKDESDKSSS